MLTIDDAIEFMIAEVASNQNIGGSSSTKRYNFNLLMLIQEYIRRDKPTEELSKLLEHAPEYSRVFLDAAHELFRRGIVRLGPIGFEPKQTRYSLETHYVLTDFGRTWIEARMNGRIPSAEPGRYVQLIGEYSRLFGSGFQQRATEAIKCYQAQAYLACCAMAGAAAESLLLHVAVQKTGNEEYVLGEYRSSGGAGKTKNLILQGLANRERQHFEGIHELIKYWRDESSHGIESNLSELEAFMSLYSLIRHSTYVRDNIGTYTRTTSTQ